ncbi:hypothetical protein BOA8489_02107 [Boseongicola aestuarii]|uniref:Uncharacterized protein n=1 Tax=Boseongicola aestuarii TaxID=1470561 RepID=A0A238J100_9RHOB|nr:hypothetical protein BOA8489_02107 [Boseongicola aestuarii]
MNTCDFQGRIAVTPEVAETKIALSRTLNS